MTKRKLVWTFFIMNFKLLKDMGFQNNVNLEVMWVIITLEGFSKFDGCSNMYKI
jgi:hypothetical protein